VCWMCFDWRGEFACSLCARVFCALWELSCRDLDAPQQHRAKSSASRPTATCPKAAHSCPSSTLSSLLHWLFSADQSKRAVPRKCSPTSKSTFTATFAPNFATSTFPAPVAGLKCGALWPSARAQRGHKAPPLVPKSSAHTAGHQRRLQTAAR